MEVVVAVEDQLTHQNVASEVEEEVDQEMFLDQVKVEEAEEGKVQVMNFSLEAEMGEAEEEAGLWWKLQGKGVEAEKVRVGLS